MRRDRRGRAPQAPSYQRINAWLTGENLPSEWAQLELVLRFLIERARGVSPKPPVEGLYRLSMWRELWSAARRGGATAVPEVSAECPYRGLSAFEESDEAWFFGREASTAALLARLSPDRGLTALVGASGAGKSSLLRAGLIPAIRAGGLGVAGSADWPVVVMSPGEYPVKELIRLVPGLADVAQAPEERFAERVRAAVRDCLDSPDARLVLIVDQAEEIFTLCAEEEQRALFVATLRAACTEEGDHRPPALGVVGLRADFYGRCLEHPELAEALQERQLVLGPMTSTELREAVVRPARVAGLRLETGLSELVLRDMGVHTARGRRASYDAGALPLLSHALLVTWQHRKAGKLTVAGYRESGGIQRAITTTAERAWLSLDPQGQMAARVLLLSLTRIGQDSQDTRRRVPKPRLLDHASDQRAAERALEVLTQARLVTQDAEWVQISHEALLLAWPRLRDWIDTDRAGYLVRQNLEEAAASWERDSDPAGLYRGGRLSTARDWAEADSHEDELSPTALAFLTASTRHDQRSTRLRRAVLATLSVLTLLAVAAAGLALSQTRAANAKRQDLLFQHLIRQADSLRSTDASLAAQLNLTAHRMRPAPELYTSLIDTETQALSTPLTGHTDSVRDVAVSPDGRTLASAGWDHTIRLWNVTDPTHPAPIGQPLTGHTRPVTALRFSPDGLTLASVSRDRTVRLWDLRTRTPVGQPLTGHSASVLAVAFSPDGHTLASASRDKTVRLWNVTDPARPAALGEPLTGHAGAVSGVVFSPDGHTLATAGVDWTIQLWNVTDPLRPQLFGDPLEERGSIVKMAFSPDGRTLAAAKGDHKISLWDVVGAKTAQKLEELSGHTGDVYGIAFSPDGRFLASGGADHLIRLWSLPGNVLLSSRNWVRGVAFSPDGTVVATGAQDHTTRLWNLADPEHPTPLGAPLTGHAGGVANVAFSPRGHLLATAGHDHTIRLWNATDPVRMAPYGQLDGHTDSVLGLAFSPDGQTLASASKDKTVRLWNVTDPAHPTPLGAPLTGYPGTVYAVAFGPDGHTLATTSSVGIVRLWDVTKPAQPTALAPGLTGHFNDVYAVAFSPDGRTLATGGRDQTVRLWNVSDPAKPASLGPPLVGHSDAVRAVAFSPDGRTLATASSDSNVRLWNVINPGSLGQLHTASLKGGNAVAFSPDGRTLGAASEDGTLDLWRMDVDEAVQRICTTTRNTLTREQWERYVSADEPYDPPCRDRDHPD